MHSPPSMLSPQQTRLCLVVLMVEVLMVEVLMVVAVLQKTPLWPMRRWPMLATLPMRDARRSRP